MKYIFICILLVVMSGCSSIPKKNLSNTYSPLAVKGCDVFLGKWKSETFIPKQNIFNVHTAEYFESGKLLLHFKELDSNKKQISNYQVVRKWDCDEELYVTKNIDPSENSYGAIKVYRLLSLTSKSIKYETIFGHSPGVTYELTR